MHEKFAALFVFSLLAAFFCIWNARVELTAVVKQYRHEYTASSSSSLSAFNQTVCEALVHFHAPSWTLYYLVPDRVFQSYTECHPFTTGYRKGMIVLDNILLTL